MSWDAFADTIAPIFGQDAETQIQQGNYRTGADDKYKPGVWDHIWGRANDGQAVLDTQERTQRRKAGKAFAEESGYTETELGLDFDKTSKGSVQSAIRRLEEGKRDKRQNTQFQQSLAPLQMQMQQGTAQFNATMQRNMANDAKSHQLQLMQLADAQDQRATEFAYQKSRDRKADMQYNERMEQLDRKDRRQAMSSIAAGLASLGAAFAA